MSENQLVDLYVDIGDGVYKPIDPKTIALGVKDESKENSNVQEFINIIDSTAVRYLYEWDATNQVDFSSIILPVKKGYTYKIVGSETTFGNRTYKPNDFLIVNKNITSGMITESDIDVVQGYGNIGLPDQTDKEGKYLKTDGTSASWEDLTPPVVVRDWD